MSRLKWTVVALGVITLATAPTAQVQNPGAAAELVVHTAQGALVRVFPSDSPEQIMQRVLSFDADRDTRIVARELPERMQHLVADGDGDRDGYLAPDEIRKLVSTDRSVRFAGGFSKGSTDGLTGVVNDLRLPQPKREQALAIVKGHTVPRIVNNPNSVEMKDVFARMREVLDDEEYENFFAAATRLRRTSNVAVFGGVVGGQVVLPK